MHRFPQRACPLPMNYPHLINAPLKTSRQIILHNLVNLSRLKRVQVQYTINRHLNWLVLIHLGKFAFLPIILPSMILPSSQPLLTFSPSKQRFAKPHSPTQKSSPISTCAWHWKPNSANSTLTASARAFAPF